MMPKPDKKHAGSAGLGGRGAGRVAVPRASPTSTAEQVPQTFSIRNGQLYPQPVQDFSHVPHTSPSVALATEEQQEAFCQAIVDHHGVRAACRAWGLNSSAVFYFKQSRPELAKRIRASLEALQEDMVYECNALSQKLLEMPPEEANLRANSYRVAFEWQMRLLGKLNVVLYGDKPTTQVNNNNLNLVVDEETRKRIQDLRGQILLPKKAEIIQGADGVNNTLTITE